MVCPRPMVVVLLALPLLRAMPKDPTTRRPPTPKYGDSIKQLTNQLMDVNATTPDITMDVRTPPRVKQAMKKQQQPPAAAAAEQPLESSHAGIAIPVNEDDVVLEESTRKYFYKLEPKSTTDRGLSTWVLLNSQTSSPSAALPASSTVKPATNQTIIDTEMVHKINKPVFKKRVASTTTRKPTTTVTTPRPAEKAEVKLTKIKASVFTSALINKTEVVQIPTIIKKTTTESSTAATRKQTTFVPVKTTTPVSKTPTTTTELQPETNSSSALLPVEAKEADTELEQATITLQPTKKPRRPANKRKKNKNHRRRKPSIDRSDTVNATASSKIALKKQKPIGTQIYNYLSREIMPTVGVGLVGLMVTAGLASYFLYPFGIARRSYDIDRKDKEGAYYYSDDYNSGGIAEEEVIGKVIAGMPGNSVGHRVATSRDAFPANNVRYRNGDQHHKKSQPKASVESVQLSPYDNVIDSYATQGNANLNKMDAYAYKADIMEKNTETGYTVGDQQFVVGNVPKEFQQQQQEVVTPAAVPEHGPRSLRIRRRRSSNDLDGDVRDDEDQPPKTTPAPLTTTESTKTTTKKPFSKPPSLLHSLISLFEVKVKLGLEVLENTSQAVARYFSKVNRRFTDRVNRTKS